MWSLGTRLQGQLLNLCARNVVFLLCVLGLVNMGQFKYFLNFP